MSVFMVLLNHSAFPLTFPFKPPSPKVKRLEKPSNPVIQKGKKFLNREKVKKEISGASGMFLT